MEPSGQQGLLGGGGGQADNEAAVQGRGEVGSWQRSYMQAGAADRECCGLPGPSIMHDTPVSHRPRPCRYDKSFCSQAAELYTSAGAINNIYYCLGYDYDSVYPGASVLMLMNKPNPTVSPTPRCERGAAKAACPDLCGLLCRQAGS